MADTGKTNTYDPDVSWKFHESYYTKKVTLKGYKVTNKTNNSGFINTISLSIIIAFLIGLICTVSYILIK